MSGTIQTEKIGKLGFGYMRLPRINGKHDTEQINKMTDAFLESGGTYFDAAYVYDGAEVALCESLIKRHPRENFQIATKLPLNMVNPVRSMEDIFNTSLERLGADYVDFYLLHGINSGGNRLAEELGAWEYVAKLKKQGLVKHVGFSFHGPPGDLDEILTKHPEAEFTQLQINYLDWDNPRVQARLLHEISRKHNVPVIVMEPLLGGKLTSPGSPIAGLLRGAKPNVSLAWWALQFVAQLEGVFVTLSGMSNYEQMADNISIYSDLKPLTNDEHALIEEAIEILNGVPRIACTECNYCKACPANIRIPMLIGLYNSYLIHNTETNLGGSYNWMTGGHGKARDCTACGACEGICPQNLEIIDTIAKVSKLFD